MPAKRSTRPRKSGGIVAAAAEIARLLGVERHTVGEWLKRGAPAIKDAKGHWQIDLAALVNWLIESAIADLNADLIEAGGGDETVPENLDRQIKRVELERKRYALAQLRRETVLVGQAVDLVEHQLATVRAGVLAVPARLSQQLDDGQRRALDEELRAVLLGLSADDLVAAAGTDPDADPEGDIEPGPLEPADQAEPEGPLCD